MKLNNQEECFEAAFEHSQEIDYHKQQQAEVYINLSSKLPAANQLKPRSRPSQITARVIIHQPILYKLPNYLNKPCIQLQLPSLKKTHKASLHNKDILSINEYIIKKKLKLRYCKTQNTKQNQRNQNSSIMQDSTARIHNLSYLHDYNWKNYRQLQQYQQYINQSKYKLSRNYEDYQNDVFDSRFQTGNLKYVYQNCQIETENYGAYFLLLEKDVNTHGYTNWFHFKINNKRPGMRKIFILNIVKKTAFYKQGMRISIFSLKKYKKQSTKWMKGGHNIHFFETKFLRFANSNQNFNCLYFQYDFEQQDDEVYFAANQPYSYSRVAQFVQSLQQLSNTVAKKQIRLKIDIVGHTLANNIIPYVKFDSNLDQRQDKDCILVLGRQHPAEIAGSYISEYMIKYLLSDEALVSKLLQQFSFIFLPIINPDGIIYGNSRCNLAGFDLNRQWGPNALKELTPETFRVRTFITNLIENKRKIKYVLDLHGHGKKLNSFLFCCSSEDRINNRIFSMILSKLDQRIDLLSCTYGINKDKQATIRAQLNDLGIKNTFTLQNSYYGYQDKSGKKIISYTEEDYEKLAKSLIQGIYIANSIKSAEKQEVFKRFGFNINSVQEQLSTQIDRLERQEKKNNYNKDLLSDSDPDIDILKLDERLDNFKNSKLEKKIKESYRKMKIANSKRKKSKKSQKTKSKQHQFKQFKETESLSQASNDEEKIAQKKVLPSKRTQTQAKFKQKQVLKMALPKPSHEKIIDKKVINYSFESKNIKEKDSLRQKNNSTAFCEYQTKKRQTRSFNRARIFSKIKTEAIEVQASFEKQIEEQEKKREQIGKSFSQLKQQSLKTMMNESISMVGLVKIKKKLKWTPDKKIQNYTQNYILKDDIKLLKSKSVRDREEFLASKEKKSYSMMLSSDKNMIINESKMFPIKEESIILSKIRKQKGRNSLKKYQRFQSFLKDQSGIRRQHTDNGNIFYYFPVL